MMRFRCFSRRSLSGKLLLLFITIIVLVVLLVSGSMRHVFRSHFNDHIRPHLLQYLRYVQNDIGLPPDRNKAQRLAKELNIEILIQDKQNDWSSHGRRINLNEAKVQHRYYDKDIEYALVEIDDDDNFLRIRLNTTTLFFGIPNRQRELHAKAFIPLATLTLILFLLYYATRRLFSPIETIQAGVQQFGAGNLSHRIDIKRSDELGELASSFNTMADDINKMLEAKRQMLLAISHELRSPLTRTKVATELLDDDEQRQRLNRDLNEIEKLIEELLETERLSTPHRILNLAASSLQDLIKQVSEDFYNDKNVQLDLPDKDITLEVDVTRIKLLLKNLIENALRYSPAGTPVRISLTRQANKVEIRVSDEGKGIDSKHIPHLTEPFYRVDPARQRETGGYGLGLYLCHMIAEAHGGRLDIISQKNNGTTIQITLPLTGSK